MIKDKQNILQQYFGYKEFRPGQVELIDALLAKKDVLGILPTGGGKSLCFQVPALCMEGCCLVVSPLIALMNDQTQKLRDLGIEAENLSGSISQKDIERISNNWLQKCPKFIFTSPERLNNYWIIERLKLLTINSVVFDEAHCLSHWGHQFRPMYRKVGKLREYLPNVPIMALTATATAFVQKDIITCLGLVNPVVHQGNFLRPNLRFMLQNSNEKTEDMRLWCQTVKGSKIVYLHQRYYTERYAEYLRQCGFQASAFHAGMDAKTKSNVSLYWMKSHSAIICATSAFGMGIDKPDVRLVVNPFLSNSPEDLYQEAGRAGRDGEPALSMALFNASDLKRLKEQLVDNMPDNDEILRHYNILYSYFKQGFQSQMEEAESLDLEQVAKTYNSSVLKLYRALKLLEKEKILVVSEEGRPYARCQVLLTAQALHAFIVKYKKYQNLLNLLVRAYPGILSQSKSLDIDNLAQRLKTDKISCEAQLVTLQKMGVLVYKAKSIHPLVQLLEPRRERKASSFYLSSSLRKIAHEQYAFFERYVFEKKQCRQQMFAEYFNTACAPCLVCDNCLRQNKKHRPTEKNLLAFCKSKRSLNDFKTQCLPYILYPEESQLVLNQLLEKKHLLYEQSVYFCQQ